ncbi:carboxyl transferase domain-containing protein [Saccharopolyspora sp. NPDC050389]|uniref:acyl-CoA carboxylase subunit beta n=1 Tax=Saccharopolyspora sp. NPDC050389 TaxID=3155516 RepID=UPI00340ED96D
MTRDHREEHLARSAQALAMGGERKLAARAEKGELNARQRVARLFDEGSFRETGLFAASPVEADRHATPADGKVTGTGDVEGRRAAVIAYDFTVKGASSGATSNKKMSHMKDLAARSGMPLVYLAESTGVRMPDAMGGTGLGQANDRTRFLRRRTNPWVSACFGYSFGSAAWHTVSSDFAVMRKGAVMAVSSPGLVSRATGQQVDGQDLGGWRVHSEVTGFADAVADTDEQAIDLVRRFLGYLPRHNGEAPPVAPVPAGSDGRGHEIHSIVPPERTKVYDVRKVIDVIADIGSVFPIKERFGKSLATCLARIGGRSVGIIANNPMFKAGAMDADTCTKATSFIVLCDSYNIPIIFLVDQPGFLIGINGERDGIVGKVINWMNALSLATVPKITVMMRKNYGQGYVNMGGAWTADSTVAWWTAEVSFMDPRSAVSVVHGINPEDDPELYERRLSEMAKESTGYDVARVYGVEDVIDPADTREFLINALRDNHLSRTGGVGEHQLSNWPTSY